MPKKILIFSTAYFPLVGGVEVAVKEITDRLPEFEFVMITARLKSNFSEHEKIGKVDIYRIGVGNHWDKFRLIWSGWKKAQELGKFDAAWSIMASYAGFAALRYKKRNLSVPFLLTLQEGDSKWDIYKHIWWCWCYFKQIFKRADRIQAISNYLARWAKDMGAKFSVDVVPNGVDVAKFKTTSVTRSEKKYVITVSRLVKKNGVEDLIRAMQFLPADVNLRIAGTGPLAQNLVNLTQQLQLKERVDFLGNITHADLPKYLWMSDVFCRPSLSEGLGISFLEAMAAGLPIVGTNVGGIPDFLKDNEIGLFCKVGDPKDIAEKIKKIFDDSVFAEKLRANGFKLVQEKYSWDTVTNQMRNIFNNLRNPHL